MSLELTRIGGHLKTWGHPRKRVHDAEVHTGIPAEFRAGAVQLVRDGGKPLAEIAGDLGVSTESLRHWVLREEIDQGQREGLTTAEREELRRLRREDRILREKQEILKKAAAFFATETDRTRS